MTPEDIKSLPDIDLDADEHAAPQTRISHHQGPSASMGMRAAVLGGPAQLNNNHRLSTLIERVANAPPGAQIVRAVGELAAAADNAAEDRPFVVSVSAISPRHNLGQTALLLACVWGRWDRSVCLIDLGTGRHAVEGAVASTALTLDQACEQATSAGRLSGISVLHPRFPKTGVIRTGQGDPLGYVSSGKFAQMVRVLKQSFERIVIAAPSLDSNFPFLSLGKVSDRLVLSLLKGKSRGAPLREIGEQALIQGMRPIEVIWYD